MADQEGEIKRLEEEKEGLVEENDRLLEEIKQLQTEITKTRKVYKERERELADDFDRQLQEFMAELEEERLASFVKIKNWSLGKRRVRIRWWRY